LDIWVTRSYNFFVFSHDPQQLGYVGLVLAACGAKSGVCFTCSDSVVGHTKCGLTIGKVFLFNFKKLLNFKTVQTQKNV
jgi:hypothetical protein